MDDNDPATLGLQRDAMLSNYMDETFALREKVMRLTLTDAEREAVKLAIAQLLSMPVARDREAADTLRSMLSRTAD